MRFSLKITFLVFYIILIVIIILQSRNNTNRFRKAVFHVYNNDDDHEEDRYEKWINDYMSNIVPGLGDLGKPVHSFADEKDIELNIFSKKAVNVLLSNRISLNRRLPDVRNPQCRNITYDIDHLPSASIIIIFHNEAWSVILRTVHSVLQETPPKLLKEIILVDDKSVEEELQGTLSYYIKTRLPSKVLLIRLSERQGLIRARLEGAKFASGDALVFLDANCEVIKEWIEPMLKRIKEKRNTVVTPLVDTISDKTLEYQPELFKFGGFSWKGEFRYVDIPNKLMRVEESPTSPIETPTIAGGLFAVDRNYFFEFGSFDKKMIGWGGENLEMSFRTWQCGGSLEVVPCSRVGHIFRQFFPYKMSSENSILINLARTANVWMDDYSRLFFFNYNEVEYGDIQDRLTLRTRLKCKSFKWYLENIYPEKFVPDENVAAYGRVRLTIRNLCLEGNDTELKFYTLKLARCKKELIYKQFFSLTNSDILRTEWLCAEVMRDTMKVEINSCERSLKNKKWKAYENGSLVHLSSRLCLDATGLKSKQEIKANICNGSPGQNWKFDYYNNDKSYRR